jgi:hypothetical protein
MATEAEAPPKAEVAPLLRGIVNDMGDLLQQQLKFARAEIREDIRKTWSVTELFGVGAAVSLLGAFVLLFGLVHLLHWLTSPAGTDPATLPLWACFGIIGGVILATGAVLFVVGRKKLDTFNPIPEQTVETVKENLEWITSSK